MQSAPSPPWFWRSARTPPAAGRGPIRGSTSRAFQASSEHWAAKHRAGTAYCLRGYAGAALWLPPDVHPDEDTLIALFQRTIAEEDRDVIFAVFEQMGSYHPDEPHWYLPLIGVDPSQQRKGYGSELMRHALMECDRAGTPAYLESTNPENTPLCKRHGFEVLGTIQVGASPPIFPMLRRPR